MENVLDAFKSPSWWILSVVIGLLLNVLAPYVNRKVDAILAARSAEKRKKVEEEKAAFDTYIKKLASRPDGLVEAKLDALYWAVRVVLVLVTYLILIQLCFAVPVPGAQLAAIPLSVLAFFAVSRHWRTWRERLRIHNALFDVLRPDDEL